jgi:hypothetical protein
MVDRVRPEELDPPFKIFWSMRNLARMDTA